MPAVKRLQESRTVEISPYGLTRGVGLTPTPTLLIPLPKRDLLRVRFALLRVMLRV